MTEYSGSERGTKKIRATGWAPRYPIAQTLADMLQYWREAIPREVQAV